MKIGILGGGQLARMIALAAYPLGIQTLCYEPLPNTSASFVTNMMIADYLDEQALESFASNVDVITYETENIPLATVEFLKKFRFVYPDKNILETAQDRLLEKKLFNHLQIPTAKFEDIKNRSELEHAITVIGYPCILKTRRFGYDGKGQAIIKTVNDVNSAWEQLQGQPLILEAFVPFERELSLIAARNISKETCFYPLTENVHKDGILRVSQAPFIHEGLYELAKSYIQRIFDEFNYIGVLTVEFFQVGGELMANEMAPRVHNSGHWTIEGAVTSQFENHIRAIAGYPLGSGEAHGHSAMLNCIGQMPHLENVLAVPEAHYHTYEKMPKPNRKVGHVTLVTPDYMRYEHQLEILKDVVSEPVKFEP